MLEKPTHHDDLDRKLGTYDEQFPYWRENELMCRWYPDRVIRLKPGSSILELGIGRGYSTQQFSQAFSRHVVVEGSQAQIERYKERFNERPSEIVHSLFEDFSTDERFDCVMFGFVLEMLADPVGVLRQYRQYLKPGGVAFVSTPNAMTLNKRFAHAAGMLDDFTRLTDAQLKKGVKWIWTMDSLTQLVAEAGYESNHIEGIYLKPIPLAAIEQLKLSDNVLDAMCVVGVEYPELCNGLLMRMISRS